MGKSIFADLIKKMGPLGNIIDESNLTRAIYSSDASLYRVVPKAVAHPRNISELEKVVDTALSLGIPITARGAGTSCAGNAIGEGLIINYSRYLNQIYNIDTETATAVVAPGVVQQTLQLAAKPFGLKLGPDPSTSSRCTIGGMIGNNACGPRALGYGKTADNIVSLQIIDGTGKRQTLNPKQLDTDIHQLVMKNLETIRTEFGRFNRQVSGYSMESLLPENNFDLAKFFAGTEGTLGIITSATMKLVSQAPSSIMVVLGYDSMADAADDISSLLIFGPTACEGIDRRIVDVVKHAKGSAHVPKLPSGNGWMFIELVGYNPAEVFARAKNLIKASSAIDGWVEKDPNQANALWKIRADGAGLAGVSLSRPAYGGWEDAAVPPAQLGKYLRDFDELLINYGLHGLPYGHFGEGCIHCRIDFELSKPDGPKNYRSFINDAADLVASYGGSMSGEHGDGRARSELLPKMYSAKALSLFGQIKQLFDPNNLLNPGILVNPRPVEENLRVANISTPFRSLDLNFIEQVHQCSGVGKCLANSAPGGGIMCPSFQATRDDKDSTRGRARALQEMVNGSLITAGWRSPEIHKALDLCLSCKGCFSECPTGIDMAAYKSRVIYESFKKRLRPRNHYSLGWLPRWGRLITSVPGLSHVVNCITSTPKINRLIKWSAGVDIRREIPKFATRLTRKCFSRQQISTKGPVLIWVDSFNDCFENKSFAALSQLLISLGYQVKLPDKTACCGLTWISTGQLDGARRQLKRAGKVLAPYVQKGIPIIGLEPSCTAVWRHDAQELLPEDNLVASLKNNVLTLAEFLNNDPDFTPPDFSGKTIVVQPHCHHASVIGWDLDAKLLAATGANVITVGGCCGLAGNFGVERGHYEISEKIFSQNLKPAIEAYPDALVLADGFSCRTQLSSLANKKSMTLAELLVTA